MRVLVTNTRVGGRGGTESFVRQLARGLQARGHSVLAYASDPSELPRLLQSDLIPVATDLENLPVLPDIIHGMHHLDAMTAVMSLPGVPALYHCHGAVWRESVPSHPRIHHHLAVSVTLAERMSVEFLVPPDRTTVLLNGVETSRFARRSPLPERPARALFYNSRHDPESPTIHAIAQAVASRGIVLDFVGPIFGRATTTPELLLPQYDLVFASGLSAIEALVCGCAVIVLGRTSCGELVRSDTFARHRQVNFTIAVNSPRPSAEAVGLELDRYSAQDADAVCERARRECDFDGVLDALLPVYQQVLARHASTAPDPGAETQAAARYLRSIVPLIKLTDGMLEGQWSSPSRATTFDELRADVELLRQRLERRE